MHSRWLPASRFAWTRLDRGDRGSVAELSKSLELSPAWVPLGDVAAVRAVSLGHKGCIAALQVPICIRFSTESPPAHIACVQADHGMVCYLPVFYQFGISRIHCSVA